MFTFGGGAVVWRSIRQWCVANSIMEAEYVATCEASMEAIQLRKFLTDLEVVPHMDKPIDLYCDNSGAIANIKESRNHKCTKHIKRRYQLIKVIVERGCESLEDRIKTQPCRSVHEDIISQSF